MKTVECLLIL